MYGCLTEKLNFVIIAFPQIDKDNVALLNEDQLQKYLTALGDRLAVLQRFSKDHNKGSFRPADRKLNLFKQLRSKMSLVSGKRKCSSSSDEEADGSQVMKQSSTMKGNKRASKRSRKLELGWIHEGKQVRKRNGGGTRSITVDKTANKESLLQKATELFFPKGISKIALLSEVQCDIVDFSEAPYPNEKTVGEIYEDVKMVILRFYITTNFKEDSSETGASSYTSQKQRETPTHIACQTSKDDVRMMPSATISTVSDEVNQSSTPTKTEGQFYELFDMIEVNCSGVSPGTVEFGPFETVPGEIADQDDTLPLPVSQSDADSFGTPVASSSHQAQVLLQSVQSVQESSLSEHRQTSEPNIPIDIPTDVDAHLEIPPRSPTPPPSVVTYLHIYIFIGSILLKKS